MRGMDPTGQRSAREAELRRALAATEEARFALELRVGRLEPIAYPAHAYCSAVLAGENMDRMSAVEAMLAAHRALTPSPEGYTIETRWESSDRGGVVRRWRSWLISEPPPVEGEES